MRYVSLRSFLNKGLNALEIRSRRTRLLSLPTHLCIEPTMACNSNCVMCSRQAGRVDGVKEFGFLSWDTLEKILPDLPYVEAVLFGGFGEPLLHPEYLDMLRAVKRQGPFVYFYTNGILLTEDVSRKLIDLQLDHVNVSFGGGKEETYRKIRGVEMQPIVENIRSLNRWKQKKHSRKPEIGLNVVAMNTVLRELKDILLFAKENGIRQVMMPDFCVYREDLKAESPWTQPDQAKALIAEAKGVAEELGIELAPPVLEGKRGNCLNLFQSLFVTWQGQVLSCPHERFILGDLKRQGLRSTWNTPALVKLRNDFFSKGIEHICPGCSCWDHRAETFLKPTVNYREFAIRLDHIETP